MNSSSELRILVKFPYEISDRVFTLMHALGKYRREGDREKFERVLRHAGMQEEEAAKYFDLIDLQAPTQSDGVWVIGSNTDFAASLGVLLNNQTLPRCWLFYRLCELAAPQYVRVTCSGPVHMGGKKSKKSGWKPNPEHTNRRIVTFHTCPLDPQTQNPLPLYELFM